MLAHTLLAAAVSSLTFALSGLANGEQEPTRSYRLEDNSSYIDTGALFGADHVQTMATVSSGGSRFNLFCEAETLWVTIIEVIPSDADRLLLRFTLNDPAQASWEGAVASRFLTFAENERHLVKTDDLTPDLYGALYDASSLNVTSPSLTQPLFARAFSDEERLAIRQVIRDCTPPMEG